MSITITKEERDALYNRIVIRLSGIDDVYRAVEKEDWATAQELGREFSSLLWLVCEDLGWGAGKGERLTLSIPPDALSRAVGPLRELASRDRVHYAQESESANERANEARYLEEACARLIDALSVKPERLGHSASA